MYVYIILENAMLFYFRYAFHVLIGKTILSEKKIVYNH